MGEQTWELPCRIYRMNPLGVFPKIKVVGMKQWQLRVPCELFVAHADKFRMALTSTKTARSQVKSCRYTLAVASFRKNPSHDGWCLFLCSERLNGDL